MVEMIRQQYISGQKNWPTRLLAKRQLGFVDKYISGKVLDVGCGDGVVGAIYPDVTSCDIIDYNKFGIEVDVCRAEKLPYSDKSFDTVCLIGVIEHTSDPVATLVECHRVCRGQLIITYPEGLGWNVLKTIIPKHGIKLHADFKMNGQMSDWWLTERKWIIPGFFVGEVYQT